MGVRGISDYEERLRATYEQWIAQDPEGFAEHIQNKRDTPIDSFYSNSEIEDNLLQISIANAVISEFLDASNIG